MENLKNQLMRIIIEQDDEIERLCKDNYYFRQWQQTKKEKETLEKQIEKLIEKLLVLDPQKSVEIKQNVSTPDVSDAEVEEFHRFLEEV